MVQHMLIVFEEQYQINLNTLIQIICIIIELERPFSFKQLPKFTKQPNIVFQLTSANILMC
jgi:hypothetical protein